jgi:hypothetical protein
MALLVCTKDLVPHAVDSPCCPECGCVDRVEQGSPEHEALLAGKRPRKAATRTAQTPATPPEQSGEGEGPAGGEAGA